MEKYRELGLVRGRGEGYLLNWLGRNLAELNSAAKERAWWRRGLREESERASRRAEVFLRLSSKLLVSLPRSLKAKQVTGLAQVQAVVKRFHRMANGHEEP